MFFEVLNTIAALKGFEEECARLIKDELNIRASLDELISEFKREWETRYNTLISKSAFRSIRQLARETVIAIAKKYSISISPAEIDYFGNAIASTMIETAELYPDALEALEALAQRNYPMYILTNLDNDIAKKVLLKNNLLRYFKGVISSDLTRVGKPAVKIFQAALNRAGITPKDALVISGLVEDLIGAKFLDLKVVFVNRTRIQPPIKPSFEINDLRELVGLLSKIEGT